MTKKNRIHLVLFCAVFSASTASHAAGPELVKDINTSGNAGSFPSVLANLDGTLFFRASDGIHGSELWKSDGTIDGTSMVLDINPNGNSNPFEIVAMDNNLYFRADDGTHGIELWKTDGTPLGTTMVDDINISGDAKPESLTAVGNTLFFSADDGVHGRELWKTDGVTTMLLSDNPMRSSSPDSLTSFAGKLYYSRIVDLNTNTDLWVSDGTESGTQFVKGLSVDGFVRIIGEMEVVGNLLYFNADGNLWKTAGTTSSTEEVSAFGLGSFRNRVNGALRALNSTLFFQVQNTNSTIPSQLWKSNGSTATTIPVQGTPVSPDLDYFGHGPKNLTVLGNKLIYSAGNNVNSGAIWVTDGTIAGTNMVKDINPTPFGDSRLAYFAALGENVYFRADDGVSGTELWKSDGTSNGTVLVGNIRADNTFSISSNPSWLTMVGDTLYFQADDGVHGPELWKFVEPEINPNSNDQLCVPIKISNGNLAIICL